MKVIGLLGGMSWESTALYYQLINREVNQRLGGLNSAKIVMFSVNFAQIERLQSQHKWKEAALLLSGAAKSLQSAGADFILICTNTMHLVADDIQKSVDIPILHIVDAVAARLQEGDVDTVGLLGTQFTMEKPFYKERLKDKHNIDVVIPKKSSREYVHKVIYEQLCHGVVSDDSRRGYINVLDELKQNGAQGVILGCTRLVCLSILLIAICRFAIVQNVMLNMQLRVH